MSTLSAGTYDPASTAGRHTALTKLALGCGMLAALLYATMNVITPMLYEGYIWQDQTVSELSAIGAPTRPFWAALGSVYTVLMIAFGVGVWFTAGRSRSIRWAGGILIVASLFGAFWPPMHMRGSETTLTDTLHIVWTMLWAASTLIVMGLAAASFGRSFRWFTIACMAALFTFGAIAGQQGPNIAANLPTPMVGVWQRGNIATFVIWLFAFSVMTLRATSAPTPLPRRDEAKFGIEGFAKPGYGAVKDAFVENFTQRRELGGAVCIYKDGEKVVDLWGGVRNKNTGEPWEENTMVVVFSATKGLAAMTLAAAHSRGLIDFDERVATYWPEFAQNGKENMTVRQLLAHQGGLHAFHEKVDRSVVADPDRLAAVMAREKPEWEPGERQAYHAITLGFYEGELIRRVDPTHRTLGQFFQDEIATRLGLDLYIRLPASIPNSRLAVVDASVIGNILGLPFPMMLAALNPRSHLFRSIVVNPGSQVVFDPETIYARELEVPSGGGVGTARAIARVYSEFATGGKELGLCADTLRELKAPARPSKRGFFDEAVRGEVEFSLGFMKPSWSWPFGHEGAFGSPGAGGALGYADPAVGVSYAYVTNRMGRSDCDPRDLALRRAMPEP